MLIFKLKNGLGNQMFILAFSLRLKELYPEHEIKYDISDIPRVLNGRIMRSLDEIFIYHFDLLTDKEFRIHFGRMLYSSRRSNIPFIVKIQNRINKVGRMPKSTNLVCEPDYWNVDDSFVENMLGLKMSRLNDDIYYFDGFFENIAYFEDFNTVIRNAFRFNIQSGNVIQFGKRINAENSVAVHIRRGDYIKESASIIYPRNNYSVCGPEYYSQAIHIIKEEICNPSFYFFTDDPEYVEDTYGNMDGFHLVDKNLDYEDLYLMTCCKNFILANSTFSFWGAYLSENNGIVIAPKTHYRHIENESMERKIDYFYHEGWIYIA